MTNIEIYTKSWCPYSTLAKEHLDRKGVGYTEIDVTTDAIRESEMIRRSGRRTVPQIFIADHHVGGSDDLLSLDDSGQLDRLLALTIISSRLRTHARASITELVR